MKTLALLAAMLCLTGGFVKAAYPVQPQYTGANQNPASFNNALDSYGYNTYYIEQSTPALATAVLGSGPGLLYGVSCSSGTLGDWGIAFDSASATNSLSASSQGLAVSPTVYSSTAAASGVSGTPPGSATGQWSAPHGAARFTNGLTFLKSGTGTNGTNERCLVQALFDANVNSTTH